MVIIICVNGAKITIISELEHFSRRKERIKCKYLTIFALHKSCI